MKLNKRVSHQFINFNYLLNNIIGILLTFKWSWLACLCITCFGLGRWALAASTTILGLLSYCSSGFSLSWTTGFGASSPWRPVWPLTINYDEMLIKIKSKINEPIWLLVLISYLNPYHDFSFTYPYLVLVRLVLLQLHLKFSIKDWC